jgi:PAS domain-containing protein
MYKLEVVSGNIDKKEFELIEGENYIGRTGENNIVLDSTRVSRKHVCITLSNNQVKIKDLFSANGTFVNGTKISESQLALNDTIIIGDFIFRLAATSTAEIYPAIEQIPSFENEAPKKNFFKEILSRFNLLEWKIRLIIFLGIYIFFTYFLVTNFLIEKTQSKLFWESYTRAKILVKYLALKNKEELSLNNDLLLDTESILDELGVIEAYVVDIKLRIRAPTGKIDQFLNDRIVKEALSEDKTIDDFPPQNEFEKILSDITSETKYTLAHSIRIWDQLESKFKTIGVACIIFNPKSVISAYLDIKSLQKEGFIIAIIPAIIIFFLIYFSTTSPIRKARENLENVIKGYKKDIPSPSSFRELAHLIESINRGIQKPSYDRDKPIASFEISQIKPAAQKKILEQMINVFSDGIIITNDVNVIEIVNDAVISILRLPHSRGLNLDILEVLSDRDLISIVRAMLKEIETNKSETIIKEIDYSTPGKKLEIRLKAIVSEFSKIENKIFIFKII